MIPVLLTSPTVGFNPTNPLMEEGQLIEPLVSVPMAKEHRFAATAAPEPELVSHGLRSRLYGYFVCFPRLLQPLLERVDRKLAHSLKLVLPISTAPASRSCLTIGASSAAW